MSLSVAVVTTSTNNPLLEQCVKSIDAQTYPCEHYIWTDGIVSYEDYAGMVERYRGPDRHLAYWPGRIGGPDIQGRRLCAAAPSLINEDIIIYLCDDDWFQPHHVESLIFMIEKYALDWAYCLRGIYGKDGEFLFDDNCESLGAFPIFHDERQHLVESCSYAVKTHIMVELANVYNDRGFGPDRVLYQKLSQQYPRFGCTGLHTMCFRLGGNPTSVSREFLEQGNAVMAGRYPDGQYPWNSARAFGQITRPRAA